MNHFNRMDRLALLDSEIYKEFERAEIKKQAQTLSDKIVQSPSAQQAIRDGIAKALENKADDVDDDKEYDEFKKNVGKLNSKELMMFFKILSDNLEERGINFDTRVGVEEIAGPTDEEIEKMKVDEDSNDILNYVKASLNHLAINAADSGNTEAAYIIERFIQKIGG